MTKDTIMACRKVIQLAIWIERKRSNYNVNVAVAKIRASAVAQFSHHRRAFLAFHIGRGFHLVVTIGRKISRPAGETSRSCVCGGRLAAHTKPAEKKPLSTVDTCTFGKTAFSLLADNTRMWYRLLQMLLNTVLHEMASRPFDNRPILCIYSPTSIRLLPSFITSVHRSIDSLPCY